MPIFFLSFFLEISHKFFAFKERFFFEKIGKIFDKEKQEGFGQNPNLINVLPYQSTHYILFIYK